ncbi:hypothetical protein, variant [Fonticula alba]|uniref:DH domain-containing protein n=1 Tax=Fonticula alba TaxID=691883 RepID=A0A058ZAX8_FONAL|nr:hypothetical protein, variant [Fonticula alba]KCV71091.1 hypothetical protein, variant [Fonticula alba]|eukprot:XP_009494213.1 hypothetical protein, variant [Fonticula alba]
MFAQPPPAAAAAAGFGAPPPGFGAPPPAGAGPADTPASLMDRLDAMEQTILQRLAEVEARVAAVERQAASITTTLLGPPSASSPATPATPVAGQPAEAPAGMLKIVQQLGSQLAHLQKSLDQMGAQGFDPHAASHAGGSDSSSIHSTESASPGGLKMMFGRKPLNRRSTGSLPYRSGGKGSDSLEEAAGSYEASAPAPAPVSSRKRWFNTDHAASVDITTLDTAEVKRQDVAYEFVDSEADYVRDLKIMLEVYKQKIVEAACISEAEVHSLFHNAEALLEANEAFAERLAARRRETPVVIHIAELLTEALPSFEPYIEYCSNHPVAVEVLSGLLRAGGAFKTQTEALWNDNPDTRRLSLESYLIKPVQRICKYPLLLRELSRSMTEEHPDFVHTQTATARIEELLSRINSATRQAANARRFAGLIEQLDLPQDVRSFELAHPGRELLAALAVRQSVVPPTGSSGPKKLMEDRQVFVFNDVLISCRADPATVPLTAGASPRPVSASGGRLILCDSISLAVVNCEPISASYGINNKSSAVSVLGGDSGSHSFHTPASFIIHLPASKETIEFVLPSEDERDSAVRLIKGAIVKLVEADPTKLINNNLNGLPLRRSAAYIPPDAGAAGGAGATQQRSRFARDKDKERPSYWTDKSSGLVFLRGSEWLKDNPTSVHAAIPRPIFPAPASLSPAPLSMVPPADPLLCRAPARA